MINELKPLTAKRDNFKAEIETAYNRIETLTALLAEYDTDLVNRAIKGGLNYEVEATALAGLQFEKKVLPLVIEELQKQLRPVQTRLEQIHNNLADIKIQAERDELKRKYKELKSAGESGRAIRSELKLNSSEFERLRSEC